MSIASHEFRTPLSSILSSVYLLSKYTGSEEQPQRDKHIGRIISSVSLLTETLNDFLSLSKIEEGNIKVQINQYDIRQQITEIISELQHLFKKEQHILYEHEGPSTNASLDISLMKHVITNLISNALKFSQGIVEVLSRYNNAQLTISVKDYGIGIPEEDQQHLFQRFFRSSNAAHIQGTGLGLNIVKKYVELMGGNITCMSKQGEGTTFILSFNGQ